jgi:hypothetical protein
MNGALWLLVGLQLRGWLRYLLRSLGSIKGALLALVGAMVFVPWLLTILFAPRQAGGGWFRDDLRESGPALLLLYCFMNVVFSSGERTIYFPPAEVNFLFPGPFGRRQLLAYKIVSTMIVGLPTAIFMTLALSPPQSWFLASFTGMLLIVLFMQLFSLSLNLIAVSVGARLYTRGRRLFAAAVALLIVAVLFQVGGPPAQWEPGEFFRQVQETAVWRAVAWPLRWFFITLAARTWVDLLTSAGAASLVNLALAGVVFALDAQFLEASATASARIYARMQRLRRGGMGSGEGLRRGGKVRVSLPMLPWLGGVGPLLWRQLTIALRGADRLLLLLLILGTALLTPMLTSLRDARENVLLIVGPLAVWLTLFLTTLLPFDFRGDIDRLAFLKTLPLSPWRLTLGQLLAPVLMMTLLQWIGLAVVVWVSPPRDWLLEGCLACAAFVVPINLLLFALDNLLFLLFPTRLMANSPGDFQALGRNVLLMIAKGLTVMVAGGTAAGIGYLIYLLPGGNMAAAVVAAWLVVLVFAASLVPLVALAFVFFDVGRDTPA